MENDEYSANLHASTGILYLIGSILYFPGIQASAGLHHSGSRHQHRMSTALQGQRRSHPALPRSRTKASTTDRPLQAGNDHLIVAHTMHKSLKSLLRKGGRSVHFFRKSRSSVPVTEVTAEVRIQFQLEHLTPKESTLPSLIEQVLISLIWAMCTNSTNTNIGAIPAHSRRCLPVQLHDHVPDQRLRRSTDPVGEVRRPAGTSFPVTTGSSP